MSLASALRARPRWLLHGPLHAEMGGYGMVTAAAAMAGGGTVVGAREQPRASLAARPARARASAAPGGGTCEAGCCLRAEVPDGAARVAARQLHRRRRRGAGRADHGGPLEAFFGCVGTARRALHGGHVLLPGCSHCRARRGTVVRAARPRARICWPCLFACAWEDRRDFGPAELGGSSGEQAALASSIWPSLVQGRSAGEQRRLPRVGEQDRSRVVWAWPWPCCACGIPFKGALG